MTRDDLLAEIDQFLARHDVGITETTFGRLAVNDGKFVGRLRDGRGLTLDTLEKVREFMRTYPNSAPGARALSEASKTGEAA